MRRTTDKAFEGRRTTLASTAVLLLAAFALCAGGYAVSPQVAILLNGRELAEKGLMVQERVYVPISVVRDITGADVRWDPVHKVVHVTTPGQPAPPPDFLFEDDFDHGMRPEWRTDPIGSWNPANGDFVPVEWGGDNRTFALVGGPSWGDYCVDVDMRVGHLRQFMHSSPVEEVGLVARARGESNYVCFVVDVRRAGQAIYEEVPDRGCWRVVRDGRVADQIHPIPLSLKEGQSVHLRLVARGQELHLFKDGMPEPIASYGAAERTGAAGLMLRFTGDASPDHGFAFDNFRVWELPRDSEPPLYPKFKKWLVPKE